MLSFFQHARLKNQLVGPRANHCSRFNKIQTPLVKQACLTDMLRQTVCMDCVISVYVHVCKMPSRLAEFQKKS